MPPAAMLLAALLVAAAPGVARAGHGGLGPAWATLDSLAPLSADTTVGGAAPAVVQSGNQWQLFGPPPAPLPRFVTHSAILDTVRRRLILFGGLEDGLLSNATWWVDMDHPSVQQPFSTTGTPPSPRRSDVAILDPVRDRMVVFGGLATGFVNDVWALSLTGDHAWTELEPTGGPPMPRAGSAGIYDPIGDRMIVFGGYDSTETHRRNDVWELSLEGPPVWTELFPEGTPPTPRSSHHVAYDPSRHRMLIFGGTDASGAALNEVWALDLDAPLRWEMLAPSGTPPGPREDAAVGIDSAGDRLMIFGGLRDLTYAYDDLWQLQLGGSGTWTLLSGSSPFCESNWGGTLTWDPLARQALIVGGNSGSERGVFTHTGVQVGDGWNEAGQSPVGRHTASAVLDPLRDRLVLFGGDVVFYMSDVWTLSFGPTAGWTAHATHGPRPSSRRLHYAALDEARDRMLIYGGYDGTFLGDVWALGLSEPMTWTPVATTGTPPSPRADGAAIFDPIGDRLVVFGGYDGTASPGPRRNDVWELSFETTPPTWTELHPVGTAPTPRSGHRGVYDAVGHRMLIFGGVDPHASNETWELSLGSPPEWRLLPVQGTAPAARGEHSLVYDGPDGAVILFGGIAEDGTYLGDADELELDGLRWLPIVPSGSAPAPRWGHVAAWHPGYGAMALFGGQLPVTSDETWFLYPDQATPAEASLVEGRSTAEGIDLKWYVADATGFTATLERAEGGGAWSALAQVLPDGSGWMEYLDREVVAGHAYDYRLAVPEGGTTAYVGEAHVRFEPGQALSLRVEGGTLGGRELRFRCVLPAVGRARLEVVDVAGRRVASRTYDGRPQGEQELSLEVGHPLAAGVYVARLEQGTTSVTRRFPVLR